MGLAVAMFVLGAGASLATSWVLVSRIERLGDRFELSEPALGLVAALAADAPEITSSITATVHHEHAIGAGVVIGSNVFNLAAVVGLAAVIAGGIALHRRVVVLGGVVATAVALLCFLAVADALPAGAALGLCAVVLAPYAWVLAAGRGRLLALRIPVASRRWLAAAVADEELELAELGPVRRGTSADALVAGAAVVGVVVASVVMERSASWLGRRWDIGGIVVGGLVLAAATSVPNAVAGAYLAVRGRGAALLSTALNSNAGNVVLGLLAPTALVGAASPTASDTFVAASYLALTVAALAVAWVRRGVGPVAGTAIVGAYLVFVAVVVVIS